MFGFEVISQKIQSCFLVKMSLGASAGNALGPSGSCASLALLPLTACASEGGLKLPVTLGEGERGGWQTVVSVKPCKRRRQRASAGHCWACVAAGLFP